MTKIEIFKPFGDAYELMKTILFRPFDLKKWFVIGFAAFLAHIGSGSFQFNYNVNSRGTPEEREVLRNAFGWVHQIPQWILIIGIVVIVFLIFGAALLFTWLRARGRFIFIDCVVRNRAAIVEPWGEFRRQGNSFFLFALLAWLGSVMLGMLMVLPFAVPLFRGARFSDFLTPSYIILFVVWIVVAVTMFIAWAVLTHIMTVVMFCRRCLVVEALRTAVTFVRRYAGEITLYLLSWILIAIGAGVATCAAICATCCVALIPYLGTVILLPVFVCLRAFGLFFLRQFGPEYDVWASVGLAPASPSSAEPPAIPPSLPA